MIAIFFNALLFHNALLDHKIAQKNNQYVLSCAVSGSWLNIQKAPKDFFHDFVEAINIQKPPNDSCHNFVEAGRDGSSARIPFWKFRMDPDVC